MRTYKTILRVYDQFGRVGKTKRDFSMLKGVKAPRIVGPWLNFSVDAINPKARVCVHLPARAGCRAMGLRYREYFYIEGKLYERITYKDIGDVRSAEGMKTYTRKKREITILYNGSYISAVRPAITHTIFYLRRYKVTPEQMAKISALIAEGLANE